MQFRLCNCIFIFYFFLCNNCHEYNYMGWKLASSYLTKSMNLTADPCEDFYGYVCGNWKSEFRASSGTESEFDKVAKEMAHAITKRIYQIDLNDTKTESFKKSLKIFYQQCKGHYKDDFEIFFKDTYEHLQTYFMPQVVDRNGTEERMPWESSDTKHFWQLVGRMQRELGLSFLFEAEVLTADADCRTVPTLHLRPAHIPRRIVLKDQIETLLTNIISKYHNMTLDKKDIDDTIKTAKQFEDDFDELTLQTGQFFVIHHPSRQYRSSYSELQKEFPDINWAAYFDGLLPDSVKSNFIKRNSVVMIDSPDFFRNISNLIESHGQIVSTNFGFMLVLQKYLLFFTKSVTRVLDRKQLLDMPVFGDDVCLDLSVRYFSAASLRLLFDEYSGHVEEWRNDMLLLKETIFASFRFLIHGTRWLDAEEKMTLIDRVNQVQFYGDIPSWITDNDVVDAKTPKYDPSLSLIANEILAQKKLFEQQLRPLTTGHMDDLPPSFVHNAFNLVRGKGSIRFLIGWQIPPLHLYLYPLAVKYGGTGFILGHELMHSFGTHIYREPPTELHKLVAIDTFGFKNDTLKKFEERSQCFVPHFNEYCSLTQYFECPRYWDECSISDCNIGNRTLEENVADAEAIKIAYHAYKFAEQTVGVEPPIPEMVEYTDDQLFFIAFAREFCTTENENYPHNMFTTHSAFRARVEQPLTNFPKFAKAFSCSSESRFGGRKDKCSIYGGN